MKITQVASILNAALKDVLGQSTNITSLETKDLVDVGQKLDDNNLDHYVKSLINHIGKVVFDDRSYNTKLPNLLMDGWEYGSILQKIRAGIPESTDNPAWALIKGQKYDPHEFYGAPDVFSKFFNSRDTKMIPMSFAKKQVRESFSSAMQLNAFFSMIENRIRIRETIDVDNLKRACINNFTAATLYDAHNDKQYGSGSTPRAVNLLYLYNTQKGDTPLKAADCLMSLDFLKFAAFKMGNTSKYMEEATTLYNIGKTVKFTPKNLQHVILLEEFASAADVFLQSDTFHNEFVRFPKADTISFWQGVGSDHGFEANSKIHIVARDPSDPTNDAKTVEVECGGILGVIADRDALGICNAEQYVTAEYNPLGEFTNQWYKYEAQYFNDYDEQFVVFYVADAPAE